MNETAQRLWLRHSHGSPPPFPTRQEALNALANYNQNPFDVDLRKLTFAEVYARWCKQKFKSEPVKPVYVAAYKNLAPLHEMIFSRIRKRHIQTVIDDCSLKTQAKSHMKTVCTQMFKFAIDMEIVTTNFAALVELPTTEASEIHKPFTREELAALWNRTDDLGARELTRHKPCPNCSATFKVAGGQEPTDTNRRKDFPARRKLLQPRERIPIDGRR